MTRLNILYTLIGGSLAVCVGGILLSAKFASTRTLVGSVAACAGGLVLSIALSLIMRQFMREGYSYMVSPVGVGLYPVSGYADRDGFT